MRKPSTTLTVKKAIAIDNYIDSLRVILQEVQTFLEQLQQEDDSDEISRLNTLRDDLRKKISNAAHERDETTRQGENFSRREKFSLVKN